MISIGLAMYPHDAESPADLVKLANSAMYASRRLQRLESANGRPHERAA